MKNILALETTDKIGSVAALAGDTLLAQRGLDETMRSAQSLIPAMRELLREVRWLPSDVQLVAVSIGPGSFTGLRVGVTATKVFAYSVGAEVLGISTLETIAAGAWETGEQLTAGELFVALDAQRGDVVVQSFALRPEHKVEALGPQELISADAWLASLPAGAIVTGPALGKLAGRLPVGVRPLARELWSPRAAVVGRLAAGYDALGRRDDVWKLAPHYFRRSAAEEKWDALGRP